MTGLLSHGRLICLRKFSRRANRKEEMSIIYTQQEPDIDIVFSVALVMNLVSSFGSAEVRFVQAGWGGEEMRPGDLALGIEAGGKGVMGEVGRATIHSCFSMVAVRFVSIEDQRALVPLAEYLDAQKSSGNPLEYFAPHLPVECRVALSTASLISLFDAMKTALDNDQALIEWARMILNGFLTNYHRRHRADLEAQKADRFGPGGRVALILNCKEKYTQEILFQNGVDLVIFVDGNDVGIRCRDGLPVRADHPHFATVVEEAGEIERWVRDPSGFLFASGTSAYPSTAPTRVDPLRLVAAATVLVPVCGSCRNRAPGEGISMCMRSTSRYRITEAVYVDPAGPACNHYEKKQ